MRRLLLDLLWSHLQALGAFGRSPRSVDGARAAAGVLPRYDRWFAEAVRILEADGRLERVGDGVMDSGVVPRPLDELWREWDTERPRWRGNPDLADVHVLLETMLRAFGEILTGRRHAMEVLFPGGSTELVENAYRSNPETAFFNRALAAEVVAQLRRADRPARILEIGAGTGATTALVLDAVAEHGLTVGEYRYTDVSRAFLDHAERTFAAGRPFLTYGLLDVEQPLAGQGVDVGGYDVVVAANVLHATRDVRVTVRNAKAALTRGGLLLLNEATANNLINQFTFGLLDGWWLFTDDDVRLPGGPLLSVDGWLGVLAGAGFGGIRLPVRDAEDLGQQILVAVSDGIVRQPAAPAPDESFARAIRPDGSSSRATGRGEALTGPGAPAARRRWDENSARAIPPDESSSRSPDAGDQPDDAERLLAHVEDVVLDVLAETLRIDRARIARHEPFSSYGLDSIFAVTIARTAGERLGVDLDITVLFEHSTLADLGEFVTGTYAAQIATTLPPGPLDETSSRAIPLDERSSGATGGAAALPPAESGPVDESPARAAWLDESSSRSTGGAGALTPARTGLLDESPARAVRPDGSSSRAADGAALPPGAVAIVGMSGRFPGAADVDELWDVVLEGRRCITRPPSQREDWAHHDGDALWGGFLDGAHEFDPQFFGMSMTEAGQVAPELRLMLMTAWNAIEDAGYRPSELRSRTTGVFVAATPSEYRPEPPDVDGAGLMASPSPGMIPNRISHVLDLRGPSEQCDTMCSSSLVALHRAVRSIRDGECEQALVGGVHLVLSPAGFAGMGSAGMLSPTGDVRPFQDGADGTVRSEGVCAVMVKPLDRAVADGDHVYAVVRGTGVAHGGRGVSFSAPNVRGMRAAVSAAYADAGVDPSTVSYVETHGMSSLLADGAELAALRACLGNGDAPGLLGSLKPCIGHTDVCSGLAALVKTVHALRRGVVPAIPGFGHLHPDLSLDGSRLRMAGATAPWPDRTGDDGRQLPRRAGVNSFGLGGVNAHVVLEQHLGSADDGDAAPSSRTLVLSARTPEALRERARRLAGRLAAPGAPAWADVVHTLRAGREEMEHRLALVAHGTADAAGMLRSWLDGRPDSGVRTTGEPGGSAGAAPGWAPEEARLDEPTRRRLAGADVEWTEPGGTGRRVPLPGYPFRRRSCFAMRETERAATRPPQAERARDTTVVEIVASVLGLDPAEIDPDVPLADHGLNSLLLTGVLARLRAAFPAFRTEWLRVHDTVRDVAARLSTVDTEGRGGGFPELVRLNDVTTGRPVFWVHGALAGVESYRAIADRVGRPFHGIQARGYLTDGEPLTGIDAMARYYRDAVRSVQPDGPYDVGGFCLGGIVAYEMVRLLQEDGHAVGSLVMVDAPDMTGWAKADERGSVSVRSAALQVTNSLLWPPGASEIDDVRDRLIHRDEVDVSGDEQAFVRRLADLAAARGTAMTAERITEFVERNIRVQRAYRIGEHEIRPLTDPAAVDAIYVRNRRGLFLGDLEPYFQVDGENFSLDHVDYRQDWERELPGLRTVDVDAAGHMTILHDSGPVTAIGDVCVRLYSGG